MVKGEGVAGRQEARGTTSEAQVEEERRER